MRRTALIAVGATLAVVLGAASSPAAPFCSRMQFYGKPDSYFLGIATADSLEAGPGRTEVRGGRGHFSSSDVGPIRGQVVRVTAFGSETGLDVEDHPEVLVVPWDYDAACRTLRWGGAATFVEPGPVGAYQPTLRDESEWVDGMPTFDSFMPQTEGFPNNLISEYRPSTSTLSAEEIFDLWEAWPTRESIEARHWDAARPVVRQVLSEYEPDGGPISQLLFSIASDANLHQARSVVPLAAGTYSVVAELPSGDEFGFYLRTADRARSAWWPGPEQYRTSLDQFVARGLQLEHFLALDERGLAADEDEPGRSYGTLWAAYDSVRLDDRWAWPGDLYPQDLLVVLGSNAEYSAFVADWEETLEPYRIRKAADPAQMHFFRSPAGDMWFETVYETIDGRRMTVRGERVSDVTVPVSIR